METFKVDFYYNKSTTNFIRIEIIENVNGWELVEDTDLENNGIESDKNITSGYAI